MPLYIHPANLIILKAAIEWNYEGGIEQFRIDYKIDGDNFNQEDHELFSITRMNLDEFDVKELVSSGLHYDEKNESSNDFTLKPRYGPYVWETDWIRDNNVFAWHKEAKFDLIRRAIAIGNESMEVIAKRFEKGENPFDTIV